jgi:hypothetical protein
MVTFDSFRYQAKGWTRARRMVANVDRVCVTGALPIASERRILSIRSRQMRNPD